MFVCQLTLYYKRNMLTFLIPINLSLILIGRIVLLNPVGRVTKEMKFRILDERVNLLNIGLGNKAYKI